MIIKLILEHLIHLVLLLHETVKGLLQTINFIVLDLIDVLIPGASEVRRSVAHPRTL